MWEGQRRVDIQAPHTQTPWSRWAAFQTFYELSLTRERERNWFQDSPELHSIMETFFTSKGWSAKTSRLTYIVQPMCLKKAEGYVGSRWPKYLLSSGKHPWFIKLILEIHKLEMGWGRLNLFIHSTERLLSKLSVTSAFSQTSSHKVVGLSFPCT